MRVLFQLVFLGGGLVQFGGIASFLEEDHSEKQLDCARINVTLSETGSMKTMKSWIKVTDESQKLQKRV